MQTSKNLKRALLIVLVLAFFAIGVAVFMIVLTPPTITDAVDWHMQQLDKSGEESDMLFIGGSRTYRSFDPKVFEKELGIKNVINHGTPAQRPMLSYYITKDYLEKYHPKYIVIGATFNGLMYKQDAHTFYLAQKRMTPATQIVSAIDHFGVNEGLLTVIDKSEYLDNLFFHSFKTNVASKIKNYSGDNDEKMGNGHTGSDLKLAPGSINFESKDEFSEDDFNKDAAEYFDKLVKLCKDSGAEVYLVTGPCSLTNIYRIDGYQKSVDYYIDYAKKLGVHYYNINYVKDRENIFSDDMYIDTTHVNIYGAERASNILAKVMHDEIDGKDTSHYFYKNLDELKKDVKRIPGIKATLEEDGSKQVLRVESLHNDKITPESRVLAKTKSGQYKVINNWTKKHYFIYDSKKLNRYEKIKVETRTGKNYPNETYAYQVINLIEDETAE